ncbi:DUF5825 family protein [Streptomyces sp. NPDC059479]
MTDRQAAPARERLVLQVGELEWWLPYRVNRWVQEAMAI